MNIKSKKSFCDFDENDENEDFDDDESNVDENNLFDDVNEDENETASAKDSQKRKRDDENCRRKIEEI